VSGSPFFDEKHHSYPSYITLFSLAFPPWFYLIAALAAVAALLGWVRRLEDREVVYAIFGLMLIDIVGLLVSLWGVGVMLFPWSERVSAGA